MPIHTRQGMRARGLIIAVTPLAPGNLSHPACSCLALPSQRVATGRRNDDPKAQYRDWPRGIDRPREHGGGICCGDSRRSRSRSPRCSPGDSDRAGRVPREINPLLGEDAPHRLIADWRGAIPVIVVRRRAVDEADVMDVTDRLIQPGIVACKVEVLRCTS